MKKLLLLATLLILIVTGCVNSGSPSSTTDNKVSEIGDGEFDIVPFSDEDLKTLKEDDLEESTITFASQYTKGMGFLKIGDKISLTGRSYIDSEDGLDLNWDFTLNGITTSDKNARGEEAVPDKRFIVLNCTVTNTGENPIPIAMLFDRVQFGNIADSLNPEFYTHIQEEFYGTMDFADTALLFGESTHNYLEPGQTITGDITSEYHVIDDIDSLDELIYHDIFGSNEKWRYELSEADIK